MLILVICSNHKLGFSVHIVIVGPDKMSYYQISSNLAHLKMTQAIDFEKYKRNLICTEIKKHIKTLEQMDKQDKKKIEKQKKKFL